MRIKCGLFHRLFQTAKNKVKNSFLTLIKKINLGLYKKAVYHIFYSVKKNEREPNIKRDFSYANNNKNLQNTNLKDTK